MPQFSSLVRFGFVTTFIAVSRIAFFAFLGFLFNIILIFFLPDMCQSPADLGWLEGIRYSMQHCKMSFIVLLLFIIAFPILYFWASIRYGLRRAIHYAYVKNKAYFYEYFMDRMTNFATKQKNNLQGDEQNLSTSLYWIDIAGRFLHRLDNTPWVFRMIFRFFKDKIPFTSVIEKVSTEMDLSNTSVSAAAKQIALEADTYIQDDLLSPRMTRFYWIIGLNLLIFGLIWLIYSFV